jgi:hypothetical protein
LGLAVGQIVGGIAITVGGFTGEVLGGAASVTGIGVAVGVPAMVVSTTLVVGGAGNIAAGIRGLMTTGSGNSGTQGTALGKEGGQSIPVNKVVNSNMPHAAERAVERAGFRTVKEARTALQELGAGIEKNGLPRGTIRDTAHADRVIVPGFGQGGAVVYQVKDGTLKLKTVLEWKSPQ